MQEAKSSAAHSNKLIQARDLLFIWKLITRNLFILIVVPVGAYVIGYLYSYRLSNIYGAKVQLLLKSNETYDYQDPIYSGLGAYGVYMDVQNQMRIVRSRDLIGEVIDRINIETSYYIVGRLTKTEVFETLPFKCEVEVLNSEVYERPIKIEILDERFYLMSYELGDISIEHKYEFDKKFENPDFRINLLKRYTFDAASVNSIKSYNYGITFHSRDYLIDKYQSRLSIENIEHTSVLDIGITDDLEQRAKVFLDTLTDSYIDYSERVQVEVNQNTLENIEKQIDTVASFIREKENELLSYKDNNSILHLEKEENEFFNQFVTYSATRRNLEQVKSSIIALEEYLNSSKDERALPPYFFIEESDDYLSDAVGKLRSKQISLEIKRTQESEENPNIINLKKEIVMLKHDIRQYLENLKTAIEKQISLTDKYIGDYQNQIKALPKSAQDILNIERELEVNNKMYLFLLEKKTNTLIARAGIIPQVRVIETTQLLGVVEPDKTKIKRLFTLAGLILALLIAFIRKVFFERIENVASLAQVTTLNILGGVPHLSKTEGFTLMDLQPKSSLAESFRTLRTNLSYLGTTDGRAKRILLSSFLPGEGKTFCSTNLSVILSKADKRTIILDFDLHRPKVHKTFKLSNTIGITNYLAKDAAFDDVVQKEVLPYLDVIAAGPIAPNPSELVLRDKVADLIKEAENRYDYVIIDTPPFGLLNDTLELLKYSDVFVIIMNTNYSRTSGIQRIEEMLSKFDTISKGVVLNNIKESRLKYYYSKYTYKYGYSYSYGYRYGYGYGSDYSNYDSSQE